MAQVRLGVDLLQLGRADLRLDGANTFTAAGCASEQARLPSCRSQGAAVAVMQQCGPQVQEV